MLHRDTCEEIKIFVDIMRTVPEGEPHFALKPAK